MYHLALNVLGAITDEPNRNKKELSRSHVEAPACGPVLTPQDIFALRPRPMALAYQRPSTTQSLPAPGHPVLAPLASRSKPLASSSWIAWHAPKASAVFAAKLAVVVGGGPMGLAASLVLKRSGWRVIVVEKRDYQNRRDVYLNVRAEFVEQLRALGVYHALENAAPARRLIHVTEKVTGATPAIHPGCAQTLMGPSIARVHVGELERVLIAAALEAGVDIKLLSRASPLGRAAMGRERLRISSNAGQHDIEADLVVVCDGAHSDMRQQLNIKSIPSSPTYTLRALVNMPTGSVMCRRLHVTKNQQRITSVSMGEAHGQETYIAMHVPARKGEAISRHHDAAKACLGGSRKDGRRFFIKHAQRLLRDALGEALESLSIGPIMLLLCRMFQSETATKGRYILAGDAVGCGNFVTSGGINTAWIYHLRAIEDLARHLLRGEAADEEALQTYDTEVRTATAAWVNE